ncbi:hypothetical protein [Microbulbifer sp. ZKSA002]|uniref:hypothetical protein n=1 Tax=Microbulbifer sp. ZKSA002 TaxID=3243388 RepID=UPI00403915D4
MSALQELLEQLHDEAARTLLERLKGGKATAAEIAQAINLLKHNGIQCDSKPGSILDEISKDLENYQAGNTIN